MKLICTSHLDFLSSQQQLCPSLILFATTLISFSSIASFSLLILLHLLSLSQRTFAAAKNGKPKPASALQHLPQEA